MKVGLVGLGKMGSAIAERLASKRMAPLVWDRDPQVMQAHDDKGLRVALGPQDIAATSDIIISIISEDSGVLDLFHGERGFLSVNVAGKLFVEMTTLQPMTARSLATAVEARGAASSIVPCSARFRPSARESFWRWPAAGRKTSIVPQPSLIISRGASCTWAPPAAVAP